MHDSSFASVSMSSSRFVHVVASDIIRMSPRHDMRTRRTTLCQSWTQSYESASDVTRDSIDIDKVKARSIVTLYMTKVIMGTKFSSGDKGKEPSPGDITPLTLLLHNFTKGESTMRTVGESEGRTEEDWTKESEHKMDSNNNRNINNQSNSLVQTF